MCLSEIFHLFFQKLENFFRINVYDKERKLFSKQELGEGNKFYRLDQIYTVFVDIIFPEKLSINYMDVLHKLKNTKNLPEEEKV